MQMKREDIKAYPKFARYVSVSIPRDIIANTFILKQIQKFAGDISITKIKEALTWGKGPMIKVTQLGKTYGAFTPNKNSHEIRIDVDRVKEFENGKGLRRTASGKLVYLVGVTLLHELTHWADDQDGVDTPGEEGLSFEKAVYGQAIW